MNVSVRVLSASGMERFTAWLESPMGEAPTQLLLDPRFSEALGDDYPIDLDRTFATTYELGIYLHGDVFRSATEVYSLQTDKGMWAWISLALIKSLVSRTAKRNGLPLAFPHYVDAGPRLAYRLIARTAWNLIRLHGDAAKFAISSPTSPWGEMAEQMTSSQEVFVHPSVWPVAAHLYTDTNGKVRRGATSQRDKKAKRDPKSTAGLGAVRRLPRTFKQFDRTYNTREMTVGEITELLPTEYSRWSTA
jgi:hypothetical protein